jgi:predicted AlkP superfamily pyrophosphatase or phosphodiesterase
METLSPRRSTFGWSALVIALAGVVCTPAVAAQPVLSGPDGASKRNVLVIGIDGTRWDRLEEAIAAGRTPNLSRLIRRGFGVPSELDYAPPEALTISEVGWSSVASGVWPEKHGVFGYRLNMDPGQATKNGYADFLTRIESVRPRLSTFLASDWGNIGTEESGGPIFGDAADAVSATAISENTVEAWDEGDRGVTRVAARYLRRGDPDAGFVYLGAVDEAAHVLGSATPAYLEAIEKADRRVGRLLRAIKQRKTRKREMWTILVTTDHGQQNLGFGSTFSHGFGSTLERTAFVIAAGRGAADAVMPETAEIVDIAPTALRRLGIRVDPTWNLDGRPLW